MDWVAMKFVRVELRNWKNFRDISVVLPDRAFIIGPNAAGKSNFLDAFRFLRDISNPGGIQKALQDRGGLSKIRSLHARNAPEVRIDVTLTDDQDRWRYALEFTQQGRLPRQGAAVVRSESVSHNGRTVLERPDSDDAADPRLLEQTALEQLSRNRDFRPIFEHFQQITYLHLVPQIIRGGLVGAANPVFPDMYGGRFLEIVAGTSKRTRDSFLGKIQEFLKLTVPQLTELNLVTDARGVPHLEARYEHWRPNAGRQDENQFSDGTLRLIGLLWMLQSGSGLLLMEEPELSLHQAVVQRLAPFISQAQTRRGSHRQAFISTHSVDLLSDEGIAPEEILLFTPTENGTNIEVGAERDDIRALMQSGLTAADAALPKTHSHQMSQMSLFEL
jgi:hypothetical protein